MLSLLLTLLPSLGSLVAGGKVQDLVSIGTRVAHELFGTAAPTEILKAMQADPNAVETFKARMEAETAQLHAELADVQDARRQTIALVEHGSPLQWAPAILSSIIIVAFVGVTAAMLFRVVPDSQVAMVLFGQLSGLTGGVMQFWLGSSQSSRAKDAAAIAAQGPSLIERVARGRVK